MPFNSLSFLAFFLVISFLVWFSKGSTKTIVILAASYFFYACAGPLSLIYLFTITIITYYAARSLRTQRRKKTTLSIAVLSIIALLLSAKYTFLPNYLNGTIPFSLLDRSGYIFPIGISFYSLQAISLLIDIKNKRYDQRTTLREIALFISFFPQSLAGPIHRAKELIPQFSEKRPIAASMILVGIKTLLFGFFCKLIVADKLALVIDPVFNQSSEHNGLSLLTASILYSFQIYFDFWGYSLIALGLGKCVGYNLKVNFRDPYLASSIKDFWHRWHISLSLWMRDYIYIPLGGKMKGYTRFVLAIFATFFVSGLWHGISPNFMIWGVTHALLYLLDEVIAKYFVSSSDENKMKYFQASLRRALLLLAIPFTWLIFRTDNTSDLIYIFKKIVGSINSWSLSESILYYTDRANLFYLTISTVVIILAHFKLLDLRMNQVPNTKLEKALDSVYVLVCLMFLILFGDIGTQQFLYFNF